MRLLQLCHRVPFPARDGGAVAMRTMTTALQSCGLEVAVFCLNTTRHFVPKEVYEKAMPEGIRMETAKVNTNITVNGMLSGLFSGDSYLVSRFYSAEAEEQITGYIREIQPDILLLESVFLYPYLEAIKKVFSGKIIYREHNLEARLAKQRGRVFRNFLKRNYWYVQAARLKKEELALIAAVDGVIAISAGDEAEIKKMVPGKRTFLFPYSVSPSDTVAPKESYSRFYFIGSLDWEPNTRGLLWFIHKVWKPYFENRSDVSFHIAGRNAPDSIKELHGNNLIFHGEVADAEKFEQDMDVLVCPVFSGSGISIKVIEAMAKGKPVLSNRLGFRSIDVEAGVNALVAEKPEEFARQAELLISDPQTGNQLSQKAVQLIRERFDIHRNLPSLEKFIHSL